MGIQILTTVIGREESNISRLDLGGRFGDDGLKILADALVINRSIKTITIGFSKNLTNVGGQAILDAVEGTGSWHSIIRSNHTLRSVYISDRPNVTISKALALKLQCITNFNPHHTLQSKVWRYIQNNMEDISYLGLESKHMPQALSFIYENGRLDSLFQFIRSRNGPSLFTNPTPERIRLTNEMELIKQENRQLKELLKSEREINTSLREENEYLTFLFNNNEKPRMCCFPPFFKLLQFCKFVVQLLREHPL